MRARAPYRSVRRSVVGIGARYTVRTCTNGMCRRAVVVVWVSAGHGERGSVLRGVRWCCAGVVLVAALVGCGAPSEPSPAEVKIGTAYRYTLYTHCGPLEALFAGEYWESIPPPEQAVTPADWADPEQRGTMTRVSEDEAVFEAEGAEIRFMRRPGATGFLKTCA